jgi:apolipoprotein N-acyltransferase
VVLIVLCLLYSHATLGFWEKSQADFKVAMFQGDLDADEPHSVLEEKYRDGYIRMADSLQSAKLDLVILPESPTPIIYQWDENYRKALEELARRYRFGLIFNNIRSERTAEKLNYYNCAYFLDGQGNLTGTYDKIHLVPFGEYIPLKSLFVFMRTITQDVGAFQSGQNTEVFKLEDYPVNATICYEAIFPDLVRRFVRDGSRLIVNLTNDRWYGSSSAPFQHFRIARWRAIENRRYFLRAANSGISAIIEPTGRIQTSTGILSRAVCEGRFAFETQQTFYTRYGNVFVFLCAIIVFGAWIFICIQDRRNRLIKTE